MAKQIADSPFARQIVRSFLDFLRSVESTSEDGSESLEVARDCLIEAFGLNLPSTDKAVPQGQLQDLLSSWEAKQQHTLKLGSGSNPVDVNSTASVEDPHVSEGKSKEEHFGKLYDAFNFKSSTKENPDEAAKAAQLFNEALADCLDQNVSSDELGEFFKSKGNQAMRSELYIQAIELYTKAISLCGKNAVYYCNRAAAYTKLNKNLEAIKDCLKAIQIDPKYSKAYSRLGSAYFALGNYHEALNKGYLRALKLDPNNQTIQENIEVTRSKLDQEQIRSLCNSSQFRSFSNGSNDLNPEFFSNYMKGLLHLSQQRGNSADPIRDLVDVFLPVHRSDESNSESSGSSEEESDDELVANLSDTFISLAQVFSELRGPDGTTSQGQEHTA